MITSSGPVCDICGKYILPLDENESVNMFSIKGINSMLCCHNECKTALQSSGNDWEKLPDGPLRQCFHRAQTENQLPKI